MGLGRWGKRAWRGKGDSRKSEATSCDGISCGAKQIPHLPSRLYT